MKYGDTVKGECKFCGCVNFTFMGKEKQTYEVGLASYKYILGICLSCGFVQWVKVC